MKLKFYWKTCTVAIAALLLTTGCNEKEESEKIITPGLISIKMANITSTSTDATFTAEVAAATYYAGIIEKSEYDAVGADEGVLSKDQATIQAAAKAAGQTVENYLVQTLLKGVNTQNYTNLKPETEYYVYAYGMQTDGTATDVMIKKAFKTTELPLFNFEIKNIQETSANIIITPQDMEAVYFFDIQKVATCDAWGGDEKIIEGLFDMYGSIIGWLVTQGVYEYKNDDFELDYQLEPGTEYYVLAFGYDDESETANTPLSKTKFKTLGEAPTQVDFNFDIQIKAGDDITIAVTPSDNNATYIWDIISATNYEGLGSNDQAVKDYLGYLFEDYLAEGYTIEEIVKAIGIKGTDSYKFTELNGGTTYYAWAVCVDAKGNTIGKSSISQSFETPAIPRGNASVSVSHTKYYDGDELYAADPVKFKDARGKAYVPTTITPSSDAAHWYVGLFGKDYTDPESVEESTIISTLRTSQVKDVTNINYLASWNTDCTFLAMATDATDKVGPIFRKLARFTKTEASPINDLLQSAQVKAVTRANALPTISAEKLYHMFYRAASNTARPTMAPIQKVILGRKDAVAKQ